MEGFRKLTGLVGNFHAFMSDDAPDEIRQAVEAVIRDKPITNANPYNAPAKQIEGRFGILERGYFSMMTGWVAGDRMNKHTHKLGAKPKAFEGTESAQTVEPRRNFE